MLNVYTAKARSAPLPEDVAARLQEIREARADLSTPEQAGRSIAIKR